MSHQPRDPASESKPQPTDAPTVDTAFDAVPGYNTPGREAVTVEQASNGRNRTDADLTRGGR